MTEDRLRFISDYMIPVRSDQRGLIIELVKEVKRARQAERQALHNLHVLQRIAKAAAQIYRMRHKPVRLVKRKAA